MRELAFFQSLPTNNSAEKFDRFIAWASPLGTAGINHLHLDTYVPDAPYFDWSNSFFEHKDRTKRTFFWTLEYLHLGAAVSRKITPSLSLASENVRLIAPSRFLRFAKAYINVIAYYRNLRSTPRSAIYAISFLEKALRLLNNSDNNPLNLNLRTFDRAQTLLVESQFSDGRKYDTGKELEILAGMLQQGHHSKTFRFSDKGFGLIEQPFSFTSRISQRARARHFQLNVEDLKRTPSERITSEEVAAVGLAYRRSLARFGPLSLPTFMAALAGLAFTTVSMRVSDMLTLGRDAIYRKEGDLDRPRIRLSRPKIGSSQDLPLTKKLGDLAEEMLGHLLAYSEPAHKALSFYFETFGADFSAIDELYVPDELRELFSKPFLTFPEVYAGMGLRLPQNGTSCLPQRLGKMRQHHFIDAPGDIWNPDGIRIFHITRHLTIGEVESFCLQQGIKSNFPTHLSRKRYVSTTTADNLVRGRCKSVLRQLLLALFNGGRQSTKSIETADLKAWMLDQFKRRSSFSHWPFVTKDKSTLLSQALFVRSSPDIDPMTSQVDASTLWWMPTTVSAAIIGQWINVAPNNLPPLLFQVVDVKLKNGYYPSLTLHDLRKYHHTTALLAGAHEVFIDELAGRTSGRQSDHYDLRSPHEILASSMDTFDPESQFVVVGPIADIALTLQPQDRQAFFYKSAAPKHVTEIGGCATDWSLEPCKQYGDCMRCDQHLWRKGDSERLSHIDQRRKYAEAMIIVAEEKLSHYEHAPRSLLLQQQQLKDDLARCHAILDVESDSSIALGDIVTFAAPSRVTSAHELTARLAAEPSDI